jgi:tRNA (mo5U34)-methyltransferase
MGTADILQRLPSIEADLLQRLRNIEATQEHLEDKVASICKETMYLQSLVRGDSGDFVPEPNYPLSEYEVFKRSKFPRMYFIEKSINDDASNWWVPNTSCLMAMARSAGFRSVRESSHPELIVCKK